MARWIGTVIMCLAVAGCGGAGAETRASVRPQRIDVPELLLAFAQTHTNWLRQGEETVEQLEESMRAARGAERRVAMRELAVAQLLAAEVEFGRDARSTRRSATRTAESAARGSHDETLEAEMAFVALWAAWREDQGSAERLAERFVRVHLGSGELLIMAWIIRGEIAFAGEEWEPAATGYRYVLGMLEHPLYALALYRTAHCLRGLERNEEGRQALREVRELGCAQGAAIEVRRVASVASYELGSGVVLGLDGESLPADCAPATPEPPPD